MEKYPIVFFALGVCAAFPAASEAFSEGSFDGLDYVNFIIDEFSFLNITSIGKDLIPDQDKCGFACIETPSCLSYNVAASPDINGNLLCELLPSDKYNNSDKFLPSKLFHHFSIASLCSSSPCKNNGKCVSLYQEKSYKCVCKEGFTGQNCETDINECDSSPCLNNGKCADKVNGFNCSCPPGFAGDRCETDINECDSSPCLNNGTCVDKINGFNCSCPPGFAGDRCETDINECDSSPCLNNGTCADKVNGFNCSCPLGLAGDRCETVRASSCKEQNEKHSSNKSQVYTLKFGSQTIPVYCHMGNFGCGDGGWTLAMKINGARKTFHYNSGFWSNKNPYNLSGGKTGFDSQETKLPTYWNTPFSKICLGMKIGQQIKFIVINKQASSLHSLIADGTYRATSLGRNTWKKLIGSQASLQTSCNKEGFNVVSGDKNHGRARIGILGNNENDCITCDSRIAFGGAGNSDDSNTCGNNMKAMGYILVQ